MKKTKKVKKMKKQEFEPKWCYIFPILMICFGIIDALYHGLNLISHIGRLVPSLIIPSIIIYFIERAYHKQKK